jgi:hypothetical protein
METGKGEKEETLLEGVASTDVNRAYMMLNLLYQL